MKIKTKLAVSLLAAGISMGLYGATPVLTESFYTVANPVSFLEAEQTIGSYEFYEPGSEFIKVHFKEFKIPKGVLVVVRNPEGTEKYVYSKFNKDRSTKGDFKDSFYAMSITGDKAIVEIMGWSGSKKSLEDRVVIDKYMASQPTEATCGYVNNTVPRPCVKEAYPVEHERGRPVARILMGSKGAYCTAFRLGSQNDLMMTNEHCVQNQADLDTSEIWFDYEHITCGYAGYKEPIKVSGKDLIRNNYGLDYTLFTVNNPELIEQFGYVGLEPAEAYIGERIYYHGHPGGRPKYSVIEEDSTESGFCEITMQNKTAREVDADYGYACDSSGGTSGSPVFEGENHRVIALNHWNGCAYDGTIGNGGVKMSRIWPDISDVFNDVVPTGDQEGPDPAPGLSRFNVTMSDTCTFGECVFTATAEGEASHYEWIFNDGTKETTINPSVIHTYDTTGVYYPSVVAIKPDGTPGGSDSYYLPVTLEGENISPIFNWRAFRTGEGYKVKMIDLSYDWDGEIAFRQHLIKETHFEADGGWKYVGPLAPVEYEHDFPQGSQWEHWLTIRDDFGEEISGVKHTWVTGDVQNWLPVIRYKKEVSGSTVTYIDTGTSDDGGVVEYVIDWSDGTPPNIFYGVPTEPVSHTYTHIPVGECQNTYIVLKVYDYLGAMTWINLHEPICNTGEPPPPPPPNQAPHAEFAYTCQDLTCNFDATQSYDYDGEIVEYKWNFGKVGEIVSHTFDQAGTHRVELTVIDDDGATSTTFADVLLTDPPVNVPPVATFNVSCDYLTCEFDASGSYDPDGQIVAYSWIDLGQFGTIINHTFDAAGTYPVTLTVTDNEQASTSTTTNVSVTAPPPPPPPEIVLNYTATRSTKGRFEIDLNWTDAPSDKVDIYYSGRKVTTEDDGSYTYFTKRRDRGTSVRVCDSGTTFCSNTVVLDF